MSQKYQFQNIIVVLPNPMGDAILCAPALRSLRQSLPHSRITFYANNVVAEILADCPWADAWLSYDAFAKAQGLGAQARMLRRRNFDAVLLLTNSFRSAFLVFLAGIGQRIGYNRDGRGLLLTDRVTPVRLRRRFAPIAMLDYYGRLVEKAVGFWGGKYQQQDHRLELFTCPDAHRRIDELFARRQLTPNQKIVIMVPGGSFGVSKWWPAARFAEVADRLIEKNKCRVIISCAPNNAENKLARQIAAAVKHPVINLAEENLRLTDLKELIRRCRLMIGNDTGPCHIAAAFDVPLVSIFGPTDPRWTAAGYEKEIRLRIDVDCGPCQQPVCPEKHHRCLQEISVDKVYAAALKLLNYAKSKPQKSGNNALVDTVGTYYSPYDEQFAPLPDGVGLIHRDYQTLLQKHQLTTFEGVFVYDKGRRLAKPGLRARERLRLELPADQGQTVAIYLKRYDCPGFWSLIWRRLVRRRRPAALYDFDAALTLAQKGIPVPRPVAFGQQTSRLGEQRSFFMSEELPRADALERLLPHWADKKKEYMLLQNKKRLINKLALLIRKLHRSGFYHRDLYLSHIFLSKDKNGSERLNLIDLQRVFRPLLNRRRWQIKDLAQLYYSGRDYFTRTDIMRFLRHYLSCRRLSLEEKNLARAVYRKARRIARHDRKKGKAGPGPAKIR